jgi:hypothetical protein
MSELSLRASRRAGELLAGMDREQRGGNRKSKLHDETLKPTLADIGISKTESHRVQRIAAITDDRFDSYVTSCLAKNKPCTAARAYKLAPIVSTVKAIRQGGRTLRLWVVGCRVIE